MNKICCVEDDSAILTALQYTLSQEGYEVMTAMTKTQGLELIQQESFDLVLLDVTLPDGSGYDICKHLKAQGDVPVIFLTACDDEVNVVLGLDMGADDYITKPFGMMEFIARVRAVLRRAGKEEKENDVLETGDLQIQVKQHQVLAKGEKVTLTLKEFELLKFLMENKGIVLTRDRLLGHVWGYDFDGETRTVDVHVRTLRQKLGECGELIETVRGVGYRIGG